MSEQDSNLGRAGCKPGALFHYAVALTSSRREEKMKGPKATLYNSRNGLVRAGPSGIITVLVRPHLIVERHPGPAWLCSVLL